MLRNLKRSQVRFIALLAGVARDQRDALLGNVAQRDLAETQPERGEHNPGATLGFEPLTQDSAQVSALREAVFGLSAAARSELYALMRVGQGHLGTKDWDRGLSETELLGDEAITAQLTADVDLHDHLLKGLYELKLAA